jgi:uncharacterized protein (TIGR03435 family)
MRTLLALIFLAHAAFGQAEGAAAFAVASVKASPRIAGRDARGRIVATGSGMSARNVSLKDLVVEAYHREPYQVSGPGWFDSNEYDIDAKADGPAGREELRAMLRRLLADRFQMKVHTEAKDARVYALVVDKNGPKIRAMKEGEAPAASGGGRRFHGEMREFANLLSIQLSIPPISDPTRPSIATGPPVPVIDRTGLAGVFDFGVEFQPESDMFVTWQRILQDQLGLKLENRREKVEYLVVDEAVRVPTAN